MQQIRGLIAYSLVFIFESSIVFAQECGLGENPYACFRYSNSPLEQAPQDWKSYLKISESVFGSLPSFEGQYAPRGGLGFLRITNQNATLALTALPNKISIDISEVGSGKSGLQLDSKNSLLVGNLRFEGESEVEGENTLGLSFEGGREVNIPFLESFERRGNYRERRKPSEILESKYENDRKWALIGNISNLSKTKLNLVFKDGAKMLGDLYANHSKISAIFHYSPNLISSSISLPVVFEGGVHNVGGEIDLMFESGGMKACSLTFEKSGIFAENGGVNSIEFSDTGKEIQKPQYLFATQIVAQTDISDISTTKNTITFKNAQKSETNFISVYDVIASSGKNIIQTLDTPNNTELNLLISRALLSSHNPKATSYRQDEIGNTIIIDGGLSVGEYAIKGLDSNDDVFGVMAWEGKNTIKLKDTAHLGEKGLAHTEKTSGYVEDRMLITPRIYAYGEGRNEVEIDGDLKLMYIESNDRANRGVMGGEIVAVDGGSNTITINGTLDVFGYRKRIDENLGVSYNEQREEKDPLNTLIGVYGNNPLTQNTIIVRNTDVGGLFNGLGLKDLVLGNVVAYGGRNKLDLYAPIFEDWKRVEIKTLVAGDLDSQGRKHAGGVNEVLVSNGSEVVIKNIITQSGGSNQVWILQDEKMSDIVQISELGVMYGSGGETLIHFGNGSSQENLSSMIKVSLDSLGGEKNLVLGVIKNKENGCENYGMSLSGSFYGKLESLRGREGGHIESNFALEESAVFVGEVMADETIEQNLLIGSNSKFALRNEGTTYFETLFIDTPTTQEENPLKKTPHLKSSVIDLATGGGSFSNITNHLKARVLDAGTFVIYRIGNHNPLMRFYISGIQEGQADRITFESLKANYFKLDTQIFLPTHLIGYDFSSDNVVFLSSKSGGEDLEIASKVSRTGIVSYVVENIKEGDEMGAYQWRLGKSKDVTISPDFIHFAGTILAHNYSFFHIHFNSLNKRMGEPRDEKNPQGFWSRVFGGEQINSQAYAKIDSKYLISQSGYDYVFENSEERDFLGVTLSYGVMSSKSRAFEGNFLFDATYAYKAFSHSAELGLYNAYFYQSGFYADSLLKLGYLITRFNGINDNSVGANISNYTLTLSQEIGYKIAFGKENRWFITPQLGLALGYLSPSNLNQEYDGQTLHSTLEGVLTLRSRLGSEVGYTLTSSKSKSIFKIGLGYVLDYANAKATYEIVGGKYIKSVSESSFISPDCRMTLSAGINIKIGDRVGLYFDAESSFFGKINTKYQLNAGIRYSFGERERLIKPYDKAKEIYTKLIAQ